MQTAEGASSGRLRGASGCHCPACISQWRSCASHDISHCLVRAAPMRCVQIGVYNEQSLERLDLVLLEAGKSGIRIIFPFVNFWPDLGGMQWYVDQVRPQLPASFSVARLLQGPRGRWGCLDSRSHTWLYASPRFIRPWPGYGVCRLVWTRVHTAVSSYPPVSMLGWAMSIFVALSRASSRGPFCLQDRRHLQDSAAWALSPTS